MTASKGNLPRDPQCSPRGTLGVKGKQNSMFSVGPVIKCIVIPPNSKIEQITYVSKDFRSVLFSSSIKLCCKFRSLQNSYKVMTVFCVYLLCLWISSFYHISIVQFLLLFRLESLLWPWPRKIIFLIRLDTNLPHFWGARNDHMQVESSSCCFPRELLSFVCPRELDCFDPWHVTRSCPIKKGIWVRRYNNVS